MTKRADQSDSFQWAQRSWVAKASLDYLDTRKESPLLLAQGTMIRFLRSRFARQESVHDYIGVLVPLEEAHLHSHSARCGKVEFEEDRRSADDIRANTDLHGDEDEETTLGTAFKNGDGEGDGMLQMDAAEYTIEGLRRDARKGEPGRRWTEYECELGVAFAYNKEAIRKPLTNCLLIGFIP